MIVDMHCHLDLYKKPFDVAGESVDRNVGIFSVTTTPKSWVGTKKLEQGLDKKIYTALGLHPQLVAQRIDELDLFDSILPTTPFVGEIGLDGGKQFIDSMDTQLKAFRHMLAGVHSSGGKIMSIHSRMSSNLVLEEIKGIDGKSILHWFTGTKTQVRSAITLGCWFSVGPAMTKTKKGLALIQEIPRNRILVETDGPFTKYNGKQIMPWECKLACEDLSRIWGIPLLEVNHILSENLKNLLKN